MENLHQPSAHSDFHWIKESLKRLAKLSALKTKFHHCLTNSCWVIPDVLADRRFSCRRRNGEELSHEHLTNTFVNETRYSTLTSRHRSIEFSQFAASSYLKSMLITICRMDVWYKEMTPNQKANHWQRRSAAMKMLVFMMIQSCLLLSNIVLSGATYRFPEFLLYLVSKLI